LIGRAGTSNRPPTNPGADMDYKVLDPKGVFYGDDSGRQVVKEGGTIYQSQIDKGFFRQGCIDNLVNEKKLEPIGTDKAPPAPSAPITSPANKKAVIPSAKSDKKKEKRK
jgi:hypothetical protein